MTTLARFSGGRILLHLLAMLGDRVCRNDAADDVDQYRYMHVEVRINTENYFTFLNGKAHAVLRDAWQCAANPNRRTGHSRCTQQSSYQVTDDGPGNRGERRTPVDRSTQRQWANPSTSQTGPDVLSNLRLSIPAIPLAVHRAGHAELDQLLLKHTAGVLTSPVSE